MINVEPVLDIIETTLWTGALSKEKPLSAILIAGVGEGKTEMLMKAYQPPHIKEEYHDVRDKSGKVTKEKTEIVTQVGSVLVTGDVTPYTLYHKYGDLLKSNQIKHIVIPDFLSILTKNKEAMPDTIRFYNALIEEGICRIESKYADFVTEIPVQIGLLTAISAQDYDVRSKSQNWGALGFLSRVLPVSFHYSDGTKDEIRRATFLREYHNEVKFALNLPKIPVYVEIPKQFLEPVVKMANELKDPTDAVGARREKQLMTFVMACALKDDREVVNQRDMDRLISYSQFFNTECKAEL